MSWHDNIEEPADGKEALTTTCLPPWLPLLVFGWGWDIPLWHTAPRLICILSGFKHTTSLSFVFMSLKPTEKFLNVIHHAALEPTKKYSEPQTESQEIGWNTTPLVSRVLKDSALCISGGKWVYLARIPNTVSKTKFSFFTRFTI